MRIGMSPTRRKLSSYRPARVTVAVLVFIPELTGYFHHRLEILKICLNSLVKHTQESYDLLVFDNGSCAEVVDYLRSQRDQGAIQFLILSSENIGKIGAFKIMFNAAPGEVIAYCDDDVLFYPGWLKAHLQVLDTFPRVGIVSGAAIRDQFRYGNQYLDSYLSDFAEIVRHDGRYIPEDWEIEFCHSTGRDVDKYLETTKTCQDILLEYQDCKAYSTATHFQFVTFKEIILQAFDPEWSGRLMGEMKELDERIDGLGYARLATVERYVQHMGNVLDAQLRKRVTSFRLRKKKRKGWKKPTGWWHHLLQLKITQDALKRINGWTYFLLNYGRMR